jgi:hypothetical protein
LRLEEELKRFKTLSESHMQVVLSPCVIEYSGFVFDSTGRRALKRKRRPSPTGCCRNCALPR